MSINTTRTCAVVEITAMIVGVTASMTLAAFWIDHAGVLFGKIFHWWYIPSICGMLFSSIVVGFLTAVVFSKLCCVVSDWWDQWKA